MTKAGVLKTALAASKLRLYKNALVPDVNTTKAMFEANEADYDGYTAGGVTVTAFLGPGLNPGGGADIISPVNYFAWTHDTDDVGNMIGGWWLELAAGAVYAYTNYPSPIGMAKAGDVIPQVIQFTEGDNPA